MEVIESESSVLKKDQLIVLYCIEEVERNYVFNTANSFTLRGHITHMSFIEKLEEMILLYDINDDEAERHQHQHQQMLYQLCVKVLSCCDFAVCTFVIIEANKNLEYF